MKTYAALDFDPAPGDPGAVHDLLRTATSVSAELEYLSAQLEDIGRSGSGWEGEAAREFTNRVGELPRYLSSATESAERAKRALVRWLERLGALQARAAAFESAAADARDELRRARHLVDVAKSELDAAPPESYADALSTLSRARNAADAARRRLENVVKAAMDLRDEHDGVAAAVAADLRRAAELAPPEPGFFERVGRALDGMADFVKSLPERAVRFAQEHAELIKAIATVLSDIGTILAIAGLIAGGPVVAGVVLGALAVTTLGLTALADVSGADVSPLTYLGNLPIGGTAVRGVNGVARLAERVLTETGERVVGELAGPFVGALGSIDEGDLPFAYWVPSSGGEAVLGATSPVGLAFWNAVQDGTAKDRKRHHQAQEDQWLR